MTCMFRVSALMVAVAVSGCGSGKYPVEGRVVWTDGTPATELAGYSVEFNSKEAKVSATGVIRSDATFDLGTDRPGDGVVPATYKVAVCRPDPEGDVRPPPLLIPRHFTDSETSGLVETIDRSAKMVTLRLERARR